MGHQSLQRSFPQNFLETSSSIVNLVRADVAFGLDDLLDWLKFKSIVWVEVGSTGRSATAWIVIGQHFLDEKWSN